MDDAAGSGPTLVAWGTGGFYRGLTAGGSIAFDHLLDRDSAKWGSQVGRLIVEDPQSVLPGLDPAATIIFVYSDFADEIRRNILEFGPFTVIALKQLVSTAAVELAAATHGDAVDKARALHAERHLLVPLYYDQVVAPRSETLVYDSVAAGIDACWPEITSLLGRLELFHPRLDLIPAQRPNDEDPYWNNGWFLEGDGRALLAQMIRLRPRQVIEIGSGNSTKYMRWAVRNFDLPTQITSIDPIPRAEIDPLCDRVVRSSVLDVDLALFDALEPGDILFHDGSHITFNGTDTVRLFLEILPRLKRGVTVHIHDIYLPYEYPDSLAERQYSEQYMLAAFLLGNRDWAARLPLHYLHRRGLYPAGGRSFWMERV